MQNKKGQGETSFILTLMIFLAVSVFLATQIAPQFPEFSIVTPLDFIIFTSSFIGIAGTCALVSGIPCAGALIVFNVLTFFIAGNPLISTLIFIPLTVTLAYVISRLSRGGG